MARLKAVMSAVAATSAPSSCVPEPARESESTASTPPTYTSPRSSSRTLSAGAADQAAETASHAVNAASAARKTPSARLKRAFTRRMSATATVQSSGTLAQPQAVGK